MNDDDRRKVLRAYHRARERIEEEHRRKTEEYWRVWDSSDHWTRPLVSRPPLYPTYPPRPFAIADLPCGAKTRAGTPCKLTSIYDNGRCKFHGGLSTGPRTAKGKRKAAKNWRQRAIFQKATD